MPWTWSERVKLVFTRVQTVDVRGWVWCESISLPVHHHRDPLPGPEGSHTLQFFVSDPDWNQKLLWVAGAQPSGETAGQGFAAEDERQFLTALITLSSGSQPNTICLWPPLLSHDTFFSSYPPVDGETDCVYISGDESEILRWVMGLSRLQLV